MQNHLEFSSEIQFWFRHVGNWTKTLTLDMSGPTFASPGVQFLVNKAVFLFCVTHFSQKSLFLIYFLGFLSFSTQNHAESFRIFIKKSVWYPKCGNLRKHKENIFFMHLHGKCNFWPPYGVFYWF